MKQKEDTPDKEEKQTEEAKSTITIGEILSNHELRLKEIEAAFFRLKSI